MRSMCCHREWESLISYLAGLLLEAQCPEEISSICKTFMQCDAYSNQIRCGDTLKAWCRRAWAVWEKS